MTGAPTIRALEPYDADGWIRCRVLSFLGTSYFDDVRTSPTTFVNPALRFVATVDQMIVGLIDVEIDGKLATIDSIAVHPDYQGRRIATALLTHAREALPPQIVELDAWTRDDAAANAWYQASGFTAEQHYLHVYKTWDSDTDAALPAPAGLRIVGAFMHAALEEEEDMRSRFSRVHICRRYVQPV